MRDIGKEISILVHLILFPFLMFDLTLMFFLLPYSLVRYDS